MMAAAMSVAALAPGCRAQAAPPAVTVASLQDRPLPSASSSISRIGAGETLHVMVGHSFVLDNKTRLRRVYVSDPAILNSITLSPTQIIVTAMAPGVTSLILLDEAGQAESYVVSSDVDVEGLRVAMHDAMRGDQVSVQGSGGRVILSGNVNDAQADSAVKLAALYTKDVANAMTIVASHPKQVRLQVRILEVDRSKLLQLGVNLFNPGGNTSFLASATTSQFPSTATLTQSGSGGNLGGVTLTTSNPLNFFLYSTKLNLGTTIQDLQNKQVLQILAEPTITTISGVKADFLSGGQFPFPVVQPGSGAGGAPIVTIQFRDYGVKVEFTPVVNEDGTIRLAVTPEVSALDYTNAVVINGINVPALSTRKAQTEVELRSGQSFAISGLLDQRTSDLLSKTPGVASIPILGNLFKSKNVNHSTTELVVVVTPTVVDPLTETAPPAEPDLPIPTLNRGNFDNSLGKDRNPQPVVPPVDPGHPLSSNEIPAPPVSSSSSTMTPTAAETNKNVSPAIVVLPDSPARLTSSVTASAVAPAAVAAPAQAAAPTPPSAAAVRPLVLPRPASVAEPVATPAPPITVATQSPGQFVARNPPADLAASAHAPAEKALPAHAMVQVMTLSNKQDADAMVAALKRHGYNVAVSHDPSDALLHLELGPFANETDAEAMRRRLVVDGYNATIK
jgi:pilus assembly protein CpaC